ncbi:hypothetical protein NIE88_13700 [Sporolactobacillus shoreicorticis]|uniref:Preprotein translocase subunit Tim44 n=1 Tax=Sporolactobacillus shoreicorticis TaxID=1923877 RepID=A0ABW5S022_9BACL|nr:hypothetical protein [Sporolactobacillus shoreicorticis]MCO7126821.1 hypothetical protein [Sporolactobacillus shoreicorticis]
MKKIMAAFLALALIFTPAGDFVFHSSDQLVSAKGYRSGVKSFQSNRGTGTTSFFKSNRSRSQNTRTGTSARNFTGGSFMRGMIFGGLSGLLFGSLFSHLGGFGMMAGFLINLIAILVVISLIRYIITSFSRRKKPEDSNPWKR